MAAHAPARVTRAARADLLAGIYAILNDETQTLDLARAVLDAGVRIVQYRAKNGIRPECARALRELTRERDALLILNDDWRAAAAYDCDGVHLGPDDDGFAAVATVRNVLQERLIGLSCGTAGEIRDAGASDVDYLGIGPVFETGLEIRRRPAARPRRPAPPRKPNAASGGRNRRNHHRSPRRDTAHRRRYGGGHFGRDRRRAAPRGRGAARLAMERRRVAGHRQWLSSFFRSARPIRGTSRVWAAISSLVAPENAGSSPPWRPSAPKTRRGVTALGPVAQELFEAQLSALPWESAGAVRVGALPTSGRRACRRGGPEVASLVAGRRRSGVCSQSRRRTRRSCGARARLKTNLQRSPASF